MEILLPISYLIFYAAQALFLISETPKPSKHVVWFPHFLETGLEGILVLSGLEIGTIVGLKYFDQNLKF